MANERLKRFMQSAMTPGGLYYPSPTEAELTYTDDEARANAAGDPDINDFPQEMIDQLKSQVDTLLSFIFPNPQTRHITLGRTRLDWAAYMPQLDMISDIPERHSPRIEVEKEMKTKDSPDSKVTLTFNCSDEDRDGELQFIYENGDCAIQMTRENEFGEVETEIDDGTKPFAIAHRLSRFNEALTFIKAERDFRRNLPISLHPTQDVTVNE